MKNLVILVIALSIFTGCDQKEKDIRYTQQSSEIDTYKSLIEAYKKKDWESHITHYADDAKIANNVIKEKAVSPSQNIERHTEDAAMFSWDIEKEEYEMVVSDKGETWVNFWGLWKGTMKSTNKVYYMPVHTTARFIDGKIVEEHGYWNNSEIVTDLLQQEQMASTSSTETD